jgi:hypothetical protein
VPNTVVLANTDIGNVACKRADTACKSGSQWTRTPLSEHGRSDLFCGRFTRRCVAIAMIGLLSALGETIPAELSRIFRLLQLRVFRFGLL